MILSMTLYLIAFAFILFIIVLGYLIWYSRGEYMNGQYTGRRVIEFHHVTWCPYCVRLWPAWNEVKKNLRDDKDIMFVEIDGDVRRDPDVKTFPTIFIIDGHKKVKYDGPRDAEHMQMIFRR